MKLYGSTKYVRSGNWHLTIYNMTVGGNKSRNVKTKETAVKFMLNQEWEFLDMKQRGKTQQQISIYSIYNTVELHLSGRWLSGKPIIRIGSALGVNLLRILQN